MKIFETVFSYCLTRHPFLTATLALTSALSAVLIVEALIHLVFPAVDALLGIER